VAGVAHRDVEGSGIVGGVVGNDPSIELGGDSDRVEASWYRILLGEVLEEI
jgi:hypothetical protein